MYLALKEGEGEKIVENTRHGKKVRRFFSFFSQGEVADLLKKAGFRVIKTSKHQRAGGLSIWLQILARKA